MTTSLSTRELSNVFTTDAADDAPSVDGNGDPRFITERDMADADAWWQELDDEHAAQMEEEYNAFLGEGGYYHSC